jgi:glucose/arabinose dehydrogenase
VGQGGLHDVIIDRDYGATRRSISATPSRWARARARLLHAPGGGRRHARLEDVAVIFHQDGPLSGGNHFGCRIVQTPDDNLFLSMGDHFTARDQAQNLGNHIGRSSASGRTGRCRRTIRSSAERDAKPEIWSYGHRNAQGLAVNPASGKLWEHEHGPRGGDEINIVDKGKNYGWPVIGFGIDYSGAKIHDSTRKDGMEQPIRYWVPSIAPSGMAFYTGDLLPAWRGNLFVGALAAQLLVRLELDGDKVVKEERLLRDLRERIRDVRQGLMARCGS